MALDEKEYLPGGHLYGYLTLKTAHPEWKGALEGGIGAIDEPERLRQWAATSLSVNAPASGPSPPGHERYNSSYWSTVSAGIP